MLNLCSCRHQPALNSLPRSPFGVFCLSILPFHDFHTTLTRTEGTDRPPHLKTFLLGVIWQIGVELVGFGAQREERDHP